jgi:hypothetical protein
MWCVSVYACLAVYLYVCLFMCICVYLSMCACKHMPVCVCESACGCISFCACVYRCVHVTMAILPVLWVCVLLPGKNLEAGHKQVHFLSSQLPAACWLIHFHKQWNKLNIAASPMHWGAHTNARVRPSWSPGWMLQPFPMELSRWHPTGNPWVSLDSAPDKGRSD